jgi:lipopolysaccharide transport system permease protein
MDDRRSDLTVYSAASPLRRPRQFAATLRSDLRVTLDVTLRLFLRDLRSQHRRSLLGYLWILIPPAVTSLAWIIFDQSGVLTTDHGDVPYPVFVIIGTTAWQGFLDGLNVPFAKLDLAQGLLTRYRLPPEALVASGLVEVGFHQVFRFALAVVITALSGIELGWTLLLVPFGAAALVLLGAAIGGFLAPFASLYGDIRRAAQLGAVVLFFAAPIVYSPPDGNAVSAFNPVSVFVVTTREWFLGEPLTMGTPFVVFSILLLATLPFVFALQRIATPHLIDRAVG